MLKRSLPYIIMGICLLIFIIIGILLLTDNISWLDTIIYNNIIYHTDFLTTFLKIITEFGDGFALTIITLFTSIAFKNKTIGFAVAINLIFTFLASQIIKIAFLRGRPIDNVLIDISGYSFPSGHSTVSMAFYGFLIYLCYKKISNKLIKWLAIIICGSLILIIGYSRIYLGAHYPSDVIAGFALGLLLLILYIKLVVKKLSTL